MDFTQSWILPPEAHAPVAMYVVVAVIAMLFTAVSKGGFGGGAGVISVPLMLQVAPLPFVVGMWLPVLLACDVATIHYYPREWSPRAALKLVPATVGGIVLAALVLHLLNRPPGSPEARQAGAALNLGVAAITVAFVLLWLRPASAPREQPWQPTWAVSTPVGLLIGVCSTLAHAAGPLTTMYFLPQQLGQRGFAGTSGRFFFLLNSLKVPFLAAAGLLTLHTLRYGLWLIVLAPLGVWLGSWLNRRLSAVWFMRLIYGCLALVALKLAFDAVRELVG